MHRHNDYIVYVYKIGRVKTDECIISGISAANGRQRGSLIKLIGCGPYVVTLLYHAPVAKLNHKHRIPGDQEDRRIEEFADQGHDKLRLSCKTHVECSR